MATIDFTEGDGPAQLETREVENRGLMSGHDIKMGKSRLLGHNGEGLSHYYPRLILHNTNEWRRKRGGLPFRDLNSPIRPVGDRNGAARTPPRQTRHAGTPCQPRISALRADTPRAGRGTRRRRRLRLLRMLRYRRGTSRVCWMESPCFLGVPAQPLAMAQMVPSVANLCRTILR